MATVRFGVLLPTRGILLSSRERPDFGPVLAMAETAEGLGFESVWVGDSLTTSPRLEPLTALAAVATRTRRVRLGTAVLLAAMRHPVLLAHAAATVDVISGGRTVLGIGVGAAVTAETRQQWEAASVPPAQRAGRLEEMLAVLRRLWTEPRVSFRGQHIQLDGVELWPKPAQRGGIPILLACHQRAGREAQFRRAALLADGYISSTDSPDEFAQTTRKVREYAQTAGRDFSNTEAAVYMTVNLDRDEARAKEEGQAYLDAYYEANRWGGPWGPVGGPSIIVRQIERYAAAGARTLIIRFATYEPMGQLELFAREIMPAFV
ncbi:MAG: LLM class flavin-dependent oxidoreductase [Chloroflexi bacterium]|nr:LLM class flavin-dependent oxidoreductase [Chloroflexota bacterium]